MPLDQCKPMIFDMASDRWSEIASGRFNNPVWSKDGKYIYFQSFTEDARSIFRMQADGRHMEKIVDFRDLQPGATVSYWGLGSDDAPIGSFHLLTADICSVDWAHR